MLPPVTGTARIDGEHRNPLALLDQMKAEGFDEGALPDARRPRDPDADRVSASGDQDSRIACPARDRLARALELRDRPRHRATVARANRAPPASARRIVASDRPSRRLALAVKLRRALAALRALRAAASEPGFPDRRSPTRPRREGSRSPAAE